MRTVEDIIEEGGSLTMLFKRDGRSKKTTKTFESQEHYEKYCGKMMYGGWKEIGTYETNPKDDKSP